MLRTHLGKSVQRASQTLSCLQWKFWLSAGHLVHFKPSSDQRAQQRHPSNVLDACAAFGQGVASIRTHLAIAQLEASHEHHAKAARTPRALPPPDVDLNPALASIPSRPFGYDQV